MVACEDLPPHSGLVQQGKERLFVAMARKPKRSHRLPVSFPILGHERQLRRIGGSGVIGSQAILALLAPPELTPDESGTPFGWGRLRNCTEVWCLVGSQVRLKVSG